MRVCRLCASADLTRVVSLQVDPDVTLLECGSCRCCQASRFPDPGFLSDLYEGYYEPLAASAPLITAASPGRIGVRIASYAREALHGSLPRHEARILDIGGGDGSIAVDVAHRLGAPPQGWQATVIESGSPREIRHDAQVSVSTLPAIPVSGTFPIVILSAILEHLTDPLATLRIALQHLASPGVLYVRTPYIAPAMRAAAAVGITIDFTYPAHLYDLGARFWDGLDSWASVLGPADEVLASRPSPVEASFRSSPVRAMTSAVFKQFWKVLPPAAVLSGGWEWVVARGP